MKNYVTFYNGNIHNTDAKRPAIGTTCFKCSNDWKYNENTTYELINIKVNGGKFDTYVLKNTETGKVSNSRKIAAFMEVSIVDWSEKIRAAVIDGNGVIDFQELRKQLETSGVKTIEHALALFDAAAAGNIAAGMDLFRYMINDNMTGKMSGMLAIGTSCKLNPFCKLNQKIDGSICQSCYAEDMRKTTAYKQAFNTLVLCTYVFPFESIPYLNTQQFRFESFSDLFNDTQVLNYVNIARKNPTVNTAIWTKRPALLHKALYDRCDGLKPENMNVIVSSMYVNSRIDVRGKYIMSDGSDMVNHVFTVYTAKYAIEHGIKIQCGSSVCIACKCCYDRGSTPENDNYFVNEVIKEEQKKYYKLLTPAILTGYIPV